MVNINLKSNSLRLRYAPNFDRRNMNDQTRVQRILGVAMCVNKKG